jgi:arsenite/tail-anchored protein-transporting ATPase
LQAIASDRRILFFGGKGGVGKTTLSAAAALHSADAGVRTLLVSTDPAHSAGDALQVRLTGAVQRVESKLWALEIDPEAEAERHIEEVKQRVREVASPRLLQEVEREIDVARVSPGAEEAALFERLASLIPLAGSEYERIIFDTAPTGHTLRLLSLPELMTTWIQGMVRRRQKTNVLNRMWRNVAGGAAGGASDADPVLESLQRRRDLFLAARTLVTDPAATSFLFVVVPERLPILETRKAVQVLARHRIPIGGVLVNRVLPVGAEGDFLRGRRDRERGYLEEIRSTFAGHPLRYFPQLETDVVGRDALRALWGSGGTEAEFTGEAG